MKFSCILIKIFFNFGEKGFDIELNFIFGEVENIDEKN